MYNQKIIEVFNNPQNVGVLHGHNAQGTTTNEQTNEIIRIYLLVENDKINEAKFKAFGGVECIALCSAACEMIVGMNVFDAQNIDNANFERIFGTLTQNGRLITNQIRQTLAAAAVDYQKRLEKEQNK